MKNERNPNYVYEMRKQFSNKQMIYENGELNHKYFLEKKGEYWSTEDNNKLIKAINTIGVGNWEQIRKEYLSEWDEYIIKLRTKILFKSMDLLPYTNKTFTLEQIKSIANSNK